MGSKLGGLDKKFSVDVIWNMGSLGFLIVAGLTLNLVIGRFYGAAGLGLFNIAAALYIFVSQFGVFGLHLSILRYLPELRARNSEELGDAIGSGLVSVVVVSTLVTGLAWMFLPVIELVFQISYIQTAWLTLLPGLWAFAINKYLMGVINGSRHMRAFAVAQSLRYIFIFIALIVMILVSFEGQYLTGILSFSELLLLPILLVYIVFYGKFLVGWKFDFHSKWIGRHMRFGGKVFLSGTVIELNTRVDILMIGAMLGDVKAGLYSIAILLVEGLGQAANVIRTNVNPLLTRYILENRKGEFTEFSRKISLFFFLFMVVAGAALVLIFPYVANLVFPGTQFDDAFLPLLILTAGLVIASSHLPFNMIFSQSNKPVLHTIYMALVLVSNIGFNLVGIPMAGIVGAAFATALSYLVSVVLLVLLMRHYLDARIWI